MIVDHSRRQFVSRFFDPLSLGNAMMQTSLAIRSMEAAFVAIDYTKPQGIKKKVVETTVPSWVAFCCRTQLPG